LVGTPTQGKWSFRWRGPYVVVEVSTPHVIIVQSIVGNASEAKKECVHVARAKYFCEEAYGREFELQFMEQLAWLEDGFKLAQIIDVKKKDDEFYFDTIWRGGIKQINQEIKADVLYKLNPGECLDYLKKQPNENGLAASLLANWLTAESPT